MQNEKLKFFFLHVKRKIEKNLFYSPTKRKISHLFPFFRDYSVNQKCDKSVSQDCMQYFSKSTIHDYFVFVISRIIFKSNQELVNKEWIMINIWNLNKITKIDTYSMFLQFEIIVSITKCEYIFIVNATTFFHQWMIKILNRHKLIIVTHRKQE